MRPLAVQVVSCHHLEHPHMVSSAAGQEGGEGCICVQCGAGEYGCAGLCTRHNRSPRASTCCLLWGMSAEWYCLLWLPVRHM